MSDLAIPLVVFIATCLVYLFLKRKKQMNFFKDMGIPGPAPNLIFGNLIEIQNNYVDSLAFWKDKYGPLFGYFLGVRPVLVVTDTELCKQIQIKDSQIFTDRPEFIPGGLFGDPRTENNMVNSKGQVWKEQRSILTPSFTTSKMKQMFPLMNEGVDVFMEKVTEESNEGNEFDIYAMFKGLTLDVISRTAFGMQTNVQRDSKDPLLMGIQEFIDEGFVSGIVVLLVLFPEFSFILTPLRNLLNKIKGLYKKASTDGVLDGVEAMVEHRRLSPENRRNDLLQLIVDAKMSHQEINNMNLNEMTINEDSENKANEVTNKAGSSSNKNYRTLSNIEAISNVVLVLFAGYDTTSTALGFLAHVLVTRQDIQDKVRQEIQEAIKEEGSLHYAAITKMKYLQQVINESLRMYPPVTNFIARQAVEEIKYGDLTIPKGMMVQIPSVLLHKDPANFTDPDKFDPDRFSTDNRDSFNPFAFQAFGNGPRNCIGMRFAQLVEKLAISRLLSEYKLVPGDRTEKGSITIADKFLAQSPKHGVFVKTEKIYKSD